MIYIYCANCELPNFDLTFLLSHYNEGHAIVCKHNVCERCGHRTSANEVEEILRRERAEK